MNRSGKQPGPPNVPAVLAAAEQLASAMSYLHSKDIIHGDLCGGNILLTASKTSPNGVKCKVGSQRTTCSRWMPWFLNLKTARTLSLIACRWRTLAYLGTCS